MVFGASIKGERIVDKGFARERRPGREKRIGRERERERRRHNEENKTK